ncbi:NAD(P)-binding protein [Aspergillus heteromorphus CBS 117.55]|uniref:NAD(P)-binding protein n=1 Tax=Aspergillus heteromorphus CBS 117.55 TaxID=1448321 RepID=A0A317V7Y4_9EURO|nr:NAD(P)-binding protein [Aspergillus heteromorphus CBS 117.55]PWY69087.1 NAD(P)-binding protein [Aspergillus heteromorphus CBS 117.55]
MKVILTGSTGFIGREILAHCLQSPTISSIVALSRRPLPATVSAHPKLTVRILDDFLTYPESLLNDLRGAEACIWALGQNRAPDNETGRKINIEYTLSAIRAFDQSRDATSPTGKFRFVYLSGGMSERDQSKSLWVAGDTRKIRGQVETELTAYEQTRNDNVEVYIARPAMVLARGASLRTLVFGMGPSIWVDDLARVLVDVATQGSRKKVLENKTMLEWMQ